jgi:twinkle protein
MEELSFIGLGIDVLGKSGKLKVKCPKCQGDRKKNRHDTPLSVNVPKGVWNCHHCGWSGALKTHARYEEIRKKAQMPEGKTIYSKGFTEYFKRRGISVETLQYARAFEKKMWMPGLEKGKKEVVACFPVYKDFNLVNVKYRSVNRKMFMQMSKDNGAEQCFIGMDRFPEESSPEHVIIVEGEIDMLTYLEINKELHVISVPQGAPNKESKDFQKVFSYIDKYIIQRLKNTNTIYLSVDDDEPGKILREELARRLGKERCKVVNYYEDCKDINDVLKKKGAEFVQKCLKSATPYPIKGLVLAQDVDYQIEQLRTGGFKRGLLIGNDKVDRLLSMKFGHLWVVTGNSGSGKTTWMDWYLTELITNNPEENVHVAYYSPENKPVGRAVAKIMEKKAKRSIFKDAWNPMDSDDYNQSKRWVNKHFTFIDPDSRAKDLVLYGKEVKQPNTLGSILQFAKVAVQQRGANILMMDPWNKIEHDIQKYDSETNYISKCLDQMIEFGNMHDVTVIIVAHPTKPKNGSTQGNFERPSLSNISGSGNWLNKADVGVVIHRDKYSNDGKFNKDAHTLISAQKHRFAEVGEEGSTKMFMDRNKGDSFVNDADDRLKMSYKDVQKNRKENDKKKQTKIQVDEKDITDEFTEQLDNDVPF